MKYDIRQLKTDVSYQQIDMCYAGSKATEYILRYLEELEERIEELEERLEELEEALKEAGK